MRRNARWLLPPAKPRRFRNNNSGQVEHSILMTILVIVTLTLCVALLVVWLRWRQAVRADYIRTYLFPPGIFAKLQARRPELSLKDCQLVARALRQFFLAHVKSGFKFVAMPSQVAGDLWHELTQYPAHYEALCDKAFGRFMHHTPAVALTTDKHVNAGLRRTWRYTCIDENINPCNPLRLPLLFALDAKLNVANGFRYAPKRKLPQDPSSNTDRFNTGDKGSDGGGIGGSTNSESIHYGEDFSSTSYDGCTDGLGDSSSGDSCGDGGGGDGGGGD